MKLAYIIANRKSASSRVRVTNLVPLLRQADFKAVEVFEMPWSVLGRWQLFRRLKNFDRVILQRKVLGPLDVRLLTRYAQRLAFDVDDAIYLSSRPRQTVQGSPSGADEQLWYSRGRRRRFNRMVHHSDLVLAGSQHLVEEVQRGTTGCEVRVEYVPSPVPCHRIPQRREFPANERPVIGWVGSSATIRYLPLIADALRQVASCRPFQLRIVADKGVDLSGVDCLHVPWEAATQEQEIAHFDIGIMPLPDTPWTRGKCAYKLLQYMAAGLPFVASAVGMNLEVADNERAGLLAAQPSGFIEPLNRLLADEQLRRRLGQHGRRLVENRYSNEAVARQLADILLDSEGKTA